MELNKDKKIINKKIENIKPKNGFNEMVGGHINQYTLHNSSNNIIKINNLQNK